MDTAPRVGGTDEEEADFGGLDGFAVRGATWSFYGVTVRIGELEIPETLHGTSAPIDPGPHGVGRDRGAGVRSQETLWRAIPRRADGDLTPGGQRRGS